jgi:Xaa-Pro aminopeptidase
MDKNFFVNNRKRLLEKIGNNSIIVLFSGEAPQRSADQNYKYTPNKNFYYLTGLDKENFILLITKTNGKVEERLYIEKSNPKLEKWVGKKMTRDEAEEKSGIKNIKLTDEFLQDFNLLHLINNYENLYLDIEKRQWKSFNNPALDFAQEVSKKYPFLNIKNIYHLICDLRTLKSEEEIDKIKEAIHITNEGIKSLMKNAKPGMMEYQLEAHFDFTTKSLGVKQLAFNTIAASGKNATVLHYEENNSRIEDNSLILFDLGIEYDYYCSDISRTFPVNGKFTERQKEIYNIVLKAQIETIKAIKPGIDFKELNNITRKVLAEECKEIGLIKEDSELIKYYYHGVSHYLGLDTHDVGGYNRKLEPGMVLTVEPGLYIEEEGLGIRIEDNILVTENGCENLSKDIIKTVEEIEEFMKKEAEH